MIKKFILICFFGLLLGFHQQLFADDKLTILNFLDKHFESNVPKPQRLWLKKDLQKIVKEKYNPSSLRISYRYWLKDNKVVWVLNEIGKERDITTGIVISDDQVTNVEVLVYRESRGGQVQNNRFTDQYNNKNISNNFIKEIDTISGATLSVNALNKQVKMALWMTEQINQI